MVSNYENKQFSNELKYEFCVYNLKGIINLKCHTVSVKYLT